VWLGGLGGLGRRLLGWTVSGWVQVGERSWGGQVNQKRKLIAAAPVLRRKRTRFARGIEAIDPSRLPTPTSAWPVSATAVPVPALARMADVRNMTDLEGRRGRLGGLGDDE